MHRPPDLIRINAPVFVCDDVAHPNDGFPRHIRMGRSHILGNFAGTFPDKLESSFESAQQCSVCIQVLPSTSLDESDDLAGNFQHIQ